MSLAKQVVGRGRRAVTGSSWKKLAGRAASLAVVSRTGLFDRSWYEAQVGRTFATREGAVTHYVMTGRFAGHSPCLLLEPEWYLPERWRTAFRDPLAHYVQVGAPAGASPHPLFDPARWLHAQPGAGEHRDGALGHFLATAVPATPMPVPADLVHDGGAVPTWGQVLQSVRERLAERSRQEALRLAPRTTADHDRSADAAFVRRWSAAAPPAADGAPLVSVVMPVRDRAAVVGAAVASVRAQTLRDWELVVVDDGSTDGTPEVLDEIARQDPRVVVVRSAGRGISAARNTALERARGRWVAFLDSDNTWVPHFLATAVAALSAQGGRAGYAVAELHRDGGRTYRALDAQVDHLVVRNHVDLNVLVLDRGLLEEVGGFDESLRRTVDYDLVWRVGRRTPLVHLPFVGVVYDDDRSTTDRVSLRELRSWKDEVRREHLVDWQAQQQAARVPGRVSALVTTQDDWRLTWRAAGSVLARETDGPAGAGADREVVVVDSGARPSVGRILGALSLVEERLRVLRAPDDVETALGLDLALAASTGEHVLLLAPDAVLPTGGLERLLPHLDEGTLAVGPLQLDWRDLVRTAGWVFPRRGTVPTRLLADHPREDARRLGPVVDVPALGGEALFLRAADLLAVRGADPLFVHDLWDVDLCLRLAEHDVGERPGAVPRRLRLVTGVEAVVGTRVFVRPRPLPGPPPAPARAAANRRLLSQRWTGREPGGSAELWARAGFAVAHEAPVDEDGVPASLRLADPVVVRTTRRATGGRTPSLRWAVQTATPPGAGGRHWGDLHFGAALASALEELGQEVVVDGRASLGRRTAGLDDVVLGIRGKIPLLPQPGAVNLLWVISHPELVTVEEMSGYDAVFAASVPWSRRAGALLGRPVTPLLQATDPGRFHPGVGPASGGHDVLFVGNSRGVDRPVVRHLVEAGVDVAVYGGGWQDLLPPGVVRGRHVANTDLPALYRGAGVVLNDHWDDMRAEGFTSNRLFDAVAVGARVVSDHVEGVEDLFRGSVRTYRDAAHLVELVRAGPDAFPDQARRLETAARTVEDHSFGARARALLDAVVDVGTRRGSGS